MFYRAPTYNLDTKTWSYTDFEARKTVVRYLDSRFKYPGRYNLKYTEGTWNEQGQIWQKTGAYPVFRTGTSDYRKHWDFEKEKSKFDGFVIYKSEKENLEYVIPGLFYFYLNYCPILDKVKRKNDLPEIYDGDLHYYLYILRCILKRKYACILKKRQSGYTLKNMSILLNCIWFGESAVAKIFAQIESKVTDSWAFLITYREHINAHCAWTRNFDPGTGLMWEIKTKRNDGTLAGNRSTVKGFTTKQDFTNGVGGNANIIFGEESGINSTLDKTHEYITSNVAYGGLVTGLIIYSGAVGELEKCEPLKKFILHPEDDNFLACPNEIEDDIEFGPALGFFAPEWWNYVSVERDENDEPIGEIVRCFDKWGNSNKEQALEEIKTWRKKAEAKKPESYRYYCSQRPLSIKEAFAFRKDSKFPINLVAKQIQRIEDKTYPIRYVDFTYDDHGKIEIKDSSKLPITEFPLSSKTVDKEGVICMVEKPIADPKLGKHYFASIDPVGEGKTTTSESLCSIYIYKVDRQVKMINGDYEEVRLEPGKIVAWWCGRFDDITKTHQRLEKMIEAYNAWTIVENNVASFIKYMQYRKKQHYLVRKKEIAFLSELNANTNVYQEYGWKNTGTLFKTHMLNFGIEFLSEQIDQEVKENGDIVKTVYGVERIPDIMLLKEMLAYYDGLNVDRIIAYCALVSFVKIQQAARGYAVDVERVQNREVSHNNIYDKNPSFFKNIGRGSISSSDSPYNVVKPMFKNIK